MVTFEDGSVIEMQWKQLVYKKGDIALTYQIVPMHKRPDILFFTSANFWTMIHEGLLTEADRQDILNKIKSVNWKRDLEIQETLTSLKNGQGLSLKEGMIELTPGYKQLCEMNLFDPEQQLTNDQVKQIYIKAETKYCEAIKGKVTVPVLSRIKGSIVEEICIPLIKKNPNAVFDDEEAPSSRAVDKPAIIKTVKTGLIFKKTFYEVRFCDEAAFRDNGNMSFSTIEECHAFIDKVRAAGYNVASDVKME